MGRFLGKYVAVFALLMSAFTQAAELSFNPALIDLAPGERRVVEVVISDIQAPGLAVFDIDLAFDPTQINIENPNAAGPLNAFVPLGNDPFCSFISRCDDPDWFLTSTGRTAQLLAISIDNVNGVLMFGYGTQQGADAPVGAGVIGLVTVVGVGAGPISTEVTITDGTILGTPESPPQRIPYTVSPLVIGGNAGGADPEFNAPAVNQNVREGQELTVNFGATDADGDQIAFGEDPANPLPPFASLVDNNDGTGSVRFLPNFAQSGVYTITVIATDDSADARQASLTFELNVINELVSVPNVVGSTQAAAQAAIVGVGLSVGAISTQFSGTVPEGNVIDQNPGAGSAVDPGTAVSIVVSLGQQPVPVPNVVGQAQAAAEAAIVGAGLAVGAVTTEFSGTVAEGSVISQDPAGGTEVAPGSAVNLVVSLGVEPVAVPNVVGQAQAVAEASIVGAGLVVGAVTIEVSDTVPEGSVISQDPAGGVEVAPGSAVNLVISSGVEPVVVPDVTGQAQAAAEAAITGAGLLVGAVTTEFSDTVAEGSVISQNPLGGAEVAPGSAVNLVVSLGLEPVAVPNVVGQAQAAAEASITGVGLAVGAVTTAFSDTVAEGSVISQDPAGGAEVAPGSAVNLVVSLGVEPVAVPNVVGQAQAAAEASIVGAGLVIGAVTIEFSDTMPEGSVISQDPAGGTEVAPGSAVNLVISSGVEPVVVPDVTGQAQAAAEAAITGAGLAVGAVTTEFSDTVAEGSVISQSPQGGAEVAPDSAVNLVVSLGVEPVAVPNVVGQVQAAAEAAIVGAGLAVGAVTTEFSGTVAEGSVISQDPAGGTEVAPGSAVNLVVSLGVEPVVVPNVVGQAQAAAEASIVGAGLVVGAVTIEVSDTVPEGSVISQDPAGGAEVAPGSAVNLVISSGVEPVVVPDVTGQAQAAAEAAIAGAGLVVGVVTTEFSGTVAEGNVISQSPLGGAEVAPGSAVNLVVSLGIEPIAVPNVVGQAQAAAEASIVGAGLVVGTVTAEFSDTVAEGNVISQNPLGGAEVAPGSTVDLVVSLGIENVVVPDVVGLEQDIAEGTVAQAGLTVGDVTTASSDTVPVGSVISQDPEAGSEVAPESAVNLVVSTGAANNAPTAQAGDLAINLGDIAMLDGSASSDPDGDELSYAWDVLSTPLNSTIDLADIVGADQPMASVIPDVVGLFEFTLEVSDGDLTDTVTVTVDVMEQPLPPVADAGPDQNVNVGDLVTMDGSATTNGEGTPDGLNYEWVFQSVPAASGLANGDIFDANAAIAMFTPDVAGDFVLALTASDANGSDTSTATVTAAEQNVAPNADAGNDQTLALGDTIFLDGTSSNDPDAQPAPLSYEWTFVSTPAGSGLTDADIANADTAEPSFVADVVGQYVVRLDVSDGEESDFDQVLITIGEAPAAPVINLAAATNLHVNVAWDPVAGADSYTLFRRLDTEVDFAPIETLEGTVGIDDLPAGTASAEYYVIARNIFGVSQASDIETVLPRFRRRR